MFYACIYFVLTLLILKLDKGSALTTPDPRCSWSIPNGRISYYCNREHGQSCDFLCNDDCFLAINNLTLYCSFGKWINGDIACKCPDSEVCPSPIPNGRIVNCTLEPTNWCHYECDANCNKQNYNLYCDSSGKWIFGSRACKCPETGIDPEYIVLLVSMGAAFLIVVLIGVCCLSPVIKSNRRKIARACSDIVTCNTCYFRCPETTAHSRKIPKILKTHLVNGGLSFPEYMTEENIVGISNYYTPDSYSTPTDVGDLGHSDQNTELEQSNNFVVNIREPKSDRYCSNKQTHKYNESIETDYEPTSIKMVEHTEAADSNSQPSVPGMTDDTSQQPSETVFHEYDISDHEL